MNFATVFIYKPPCTMEAAGVGCTTPIRKEGSAATIAAKVGFTIFRWKDYRTPQ
jgi:hypothetical protein